MDPEAREALAVIQHCLASGRFRVLGHFLHRMDERGLFWPDIQAVVATPSDIEGDGEDKYGRPRWVLSGSSTDGLKLTVVCVLDIDEQGEVAVFITVHWAKR